MTATIDATEPAAGASWAYRARFQDPLVEVRVVKAGVKTPKRVLVQFVDDEFEGRQEWVPPARLKVPWENVAAFIEKERRWDAVSSVTPGRDSPDVSAAEIVFDLLIRPELAELGYNVTEGVIRIHDTAELAGFLGLDPADLGTDPTAFEEDGDLVASWLVTRRLARLASERDPNRVLAYVEREEADARREAVCGRSYPRRGRSESWSVSAEICAQLDEEHGRPVRTILRGWSGHGPAELRDEIAEHRHELTRLAALAAASLRALREGGLTRQANALERKYGGADVVSVREASRGATTGPRTVDAATSLTSDTTSAHTPGSAGLPTVAEE